MTGYIYIITATAINWNSGEVNFYDTTGLLFYKELNGIVALVFILLFVASFAMLYGPVTWRLFAKIFPNSIRGRSMSVDTAAMWTSNFLVRKYFLY
ncbi:MAG: MFS transporter [Marinilabiliaceae bacterium]|nr:MFS transporter [Marinilabiliaceae bacterium]